MINHFLGNNIWSNVVIVAMGGLRQHPVEVRCQGATTAANNLPNRPKINFTGRLVSHELEWRYQTGIREPQRKKHVKLFKMFSTP